MLKDVSVMLDVTQCYRGTAQPERTPIPLMDYVLNVVSIECLSYFILVCTELDPQSVVTMVRDFLV